MPLGQVLVLTRLMYGDATELVPIPPEGILDVEGKWWASDQAAVDEHIH